MNRDEIMALAHQATGDWWIDAVTEVEEAHIQRFAALLIAAEREACARLADALDDMTGREIAANIRARGQE